MLNGLGAALGDKHKRRCIPGQARVPGVISACTFIGGAKHTATESRKFDVVSEIEGSSGLWPVMLLMCLATLGVTLHDASILY